MYPYATTTNQEYIINELETLNTNITELTTSIKSGMLTISILITLIYIRNLILKCLGAKS